MFLRPRSWLPRQAIDFYDAHRFEAATVWGRLRQKQYTDTKFDHLQVGSYDKRLPGFLNTDHFAFVADFHVDIRYPMPFADERWSGIFAHHTVEHVSYEEALAFFREAHRCLRPGGTLRVVVPDVAKFIRIYVNGGDFSSLIPPGHVDSVRPKTALGFVNWAFFSTPGNRHRSAWDLETFTHALRECGFGTVEQSECAVSRDPKMCRIDTADWAAHSLYVEAVKTSGLG
jgi:SAM-dependent methyltransferase